MISMVAKAAREKNLRAGVGLLGEAFTVVAKEHAGTDNPWPRIDIVNEFKEHTAEGGLQVNVIPGEVVGRTRGGVVKGVHTTRTRGGKLVSETITETSNLYNPDGTLNEDMFAVLAHEYGHGLQRVSMKNVPENQRALIPIESIEGANQALVMKVWEVMHKIRHGEKYGGVYLKAKNRLEKAYGREVVDALPEIKLETMAYQDKVTRYPGAVFMARNPKLFDEKGLEARVKDKHLRKMGEDIELQWKASGEVNLNQLVPALVDTKVWNGKITNMEGYVWDLGKEAGAVLKKFAPLTETEKKPEAKLITGFYGRELKHLREITKLREMREKLGRGQLPKKEVAMLHDFALKHDLSEGMKAANHKALVDNALAFKFGQLEGNRLRIEEAAGVLGRRLKRLHDTGYFPEDKLAEIWGREGFISNPKRRKDLEDIRERGRKRERGFTPKEAGKGMFDRLFKGREEKPTARRGGMKR